jgi:hypothetical protein
MTCPLSGRVRAVACVLVLAAWGIVVYLVLQAGVPDWMIFVALCGILAGGWLWAREADPERAWLLAMLAAMNAMLALVTFARQ